MTFFQRNVVLLIGILWLVTILHASTTASAAVGTAPRYYQLDRTTTLVVPDSRFPMVCTYIESVKTPEREIRVNGRPERLPAVFTSGVGCVLMPDAMFDAFLERYP